jgi:hypothetical protein
MVHNLKISPNSGANSRPRRQKSHGYSNFTTEIMIFPAIVSFSDFGVDVTTRHKSPSVKSVFSCPRVLLHVVDRIHAKS